MLPTGNLVHEDCILLCVILWPAQDIWAGAEFQEQKRIDACLPVAVLGLHDEAARGQVREDH
jgi:hypothetical protein